MEYDHADHFPLVFESSEIKGRWVECKAKLHTENKNTRTKLRKQISFWNLINPDQIWILITLFR